MNTHRRLLLLSVFGAFGFAVALCIVLSTASAPDRSVLASSTKPPILDERSKTVLLSDLAPKQETELTGPVVIAPHPLRASQFQGLPEIASDQVIQKVAEQLKEQLNKAKKDQPSKATPATNSDSMEAEPVPSPQPAQTIRKPAKNEINGNAEDGLTINIQNTDIRQVLDALGKQGNLNILTSKNVTGMVSATLKNVSVQDALNAILKTMGFINKKEGEFIFIGTTEDFTAMEHSQEQVSNRVYRLNYIKASELQTLIQPLLTKNVGVVSLTSAASTGIEPNQNSAEGDNYAGGEAVVVRDYETVLAQIDQLVSEIDSPPLQVHIEAMILEIKLKDEDSFGIDFNLLRDQPTIKFGLGSPPATLGQVTFEDGGLKFGFLDSSLGVFIDALEKIGDTNVIATPRLMVINKHRAEIQIGEQLGYLSTTVTETTSTQTVEFLDIGTLLRLRPFISSDGFIRMEVHPELSTGTVTVEKEFTLPNKRVTQVTTNVMVRDGCTVVIGGLLKEDLEATVTQVPLFGNLPLVGPAFRQKKEQIQRHEILVLITPTIVRQPQVCYEGEQEACEFIRRQDVFREKMTYVGKRSIGRRYFRLAQRAWASGNRKSALRFAELSVHFDPTNRAAIDLRADIWQGKRVGEHTLVMPLPDECPPINESLDGQEIAPWLLNSLEGNQSALEPVPHQAPILEEVQNDH